MTDQSTPEAGPSTQAGSRRPPTRHSWPIPNSAAATGSRAMSTRPGKPNRTPVTMPVASPAEIDTTIVTQSADGLHQHAGTLADRVIELHGTMHTVICVKCERLSPTADVLTRIEAGEATPPCLECGGILKTASTMFGQTMSTEVWGATQPVVPIRRGVPIRREVGSAGRATRPEHGVHH
jgi:hypothetical protein